MQTPASARAMTNPRKVLLVHNRYRQHAGEDVVVDAEHALLREHGHTVIPFFLDNQDFGNAGLGVALKAIWNFDTVSKLKKLIAETKPDIAHFHNTLALVSPAGHWAAKKMGLPVVQTLHNYRISCVNAAFYREGNVCEDCLPSPMAWRGVVRKCYQNNTAASLTVAISAAVQKFIALHRRNVDVFIALSEFSRDKFISIGLPPDRIQVKSNFLLDNPQLAWRPKSHMLYVGRLSHEKGIDTLLDAWVSHSLPVGLRIAGNGPLASKVQAAQLRNPAIEWLGSISKQEVFAQLAEARALIFPSECFENFPMSLVEAGACGVPCVASNRGAAKELIEHMQTGLLFDPGDAASLAQNVRLAASDDELMKSMGSRIADKFSQRFSKSVNYERLMEIYAIAEKMHLKSRHDLHTAPSGD